MLEPEIDDHEFHLWWLAQWQKRGYQFGYRYAKVEERERELRQRNLPKNTEELCPHGESPLRCNVCYFEHYNK